MSKDPDIKDESRNAQDEDWDPGNPTTGSSRESPSSDYELERTLANYGAVEPDTTSPPSEETLEGDEEPEGRADRAAPKMPLNPSQARAFLDACMNSSPRVKYGLGAKVPFHGATPGVHFTKVDCSGFVREAIWRSTTPRLNFKDGSVVQHDWIKAQGYKKGTIDDALLSDGATRIVFYRPQDSPSGIGHVALVHNGRTLESHGGTGPNTRVWNKAGWQSKAFVYLLTDPTQ